MLVLVVPVTATKSAPSPTVDIIALEHGSIRTGNHEHDQAFWGV